MRKCGVRLAAALLLALGLWGSAPTLEWPGQRQHAPVRHEIVADPGGSGGGNGG